MSNLATLNAKFETASGQVELTPEIVKRYLVKGQADKITDQELALFIGLCQYRRLNPFIGEAYLIKFGNDAQMVVGKDVFTQREAKHPDSDGFEAGVVVVNSLGEEIRREGAMVFDGETLVGGWSKVYKKSRPERPFVHTVGLKEYRRKKADGSFMAQWGDNAPTMIRKVALVQNLREQYPDEFGGMYDAIEMPVNFNGEGNFTNPKPQVAAPKSKNQQQPAASGEKAPPPTDNDAPGGTRQGELLSENIPNCTKCGLPVGKTEAEASKVIDWCASKDWPVLCRKCQPK